MTVTQKKWRRAGESNSQGLLHLVRVRAGCRRLSAWPSVFVKALVSGGRGGTRTRNPFSRATRFPTGPLTFRSPFRKVLTRTPGGERGIRTLAPCNRWPPISNRAQFHSAISPDSVPKATSIHEGYKRKTPWPSGDQGVDDLLSMSKIRSQLPPGRPTGRRGAQ